MMGSSKRLGGDGDIGKQSCGPRFQEKDIFSSLKQDIKNAPGVLCRSSI